MASEDDPVGTAELPPTGAAPFRGLLFPTAPPPDGDVAQPDHFADLNLDQLERAVTVGRDRYRLAPFFRTPQRDLTVVRYRQDVFADLEHEATRGALTDFGDRLSAARNTLAHAARIAQPHARHRRHLHGVHQYCTALTDLAAALDELPLRSAGLAGWREFLRHHLAGAGFAALRAETTDLVARCDAVQYNILVRGNRLTVGPFDGEADYTAQVLTTFARFRPGAAPDRPAAVPVSTGLDRVQAAVLDLVADLHPDLFADLADYCARRPDIAEPTVDRVDRELQFYLAYLSYLAPLRRAGLRLSLPRLTADPATPVRAHGTFDLALAGKLAGTRSPVVTNDVRLDGAERILVVSGPNQGGKTTFARTVGQLFHLAALGCPVPGTDVRLFLADRVLTHFAREEELETLASRLEDDLLRMRELFAAATGRSVIILNEVFASTTVDDAAELSRRALRRISDLDAVCVIVTFIDELATLNEKTVSMMSTVDPADPAIRTYRVVRAPADGRAHALAIARKHGLTYELLKDRIG